MATSTATRFGPGLPVRQRAIKRTGDRWLMRRLTAAWGLLVLNVLTFPGPALLPIPTAVGKMITQGSLSVALLLALTVNPKSVLRPSVYLCLTTLLALEAVLTAAIAESPSSAYYAFRFIEFAAVLWLLSPYWGRHDVLIPRLHLKVMSWITASVILGLVISPGTALDTDGRLQGIIWPIPATQAAHYAAVALGMAVILWFFGQISGWKTLIVVVTAGTVLLLTHTRTALIACIAGLAVGSLSVIVVNPRVRKLFLGIVIAGSVVALTASSAIISWLERGQSSSGQLADLTGRTNYWANVLTEPRTRFQEIFGFGISNGIVDGHVVDSNWILSYQDQGLYGVVVCALILMFLLLTAFFETRSLNRALALFLVTYCLVASFTEVGFTGASTYSLDLTVAASLLASSGSNASGIYQRIFHPT
jgi:hypothetical protein